MSTRVTQVIQMTPVQLPDGEYKGSWGGYTVSFTYNGHAHEASTERGIRTTNAKCIITVKDGEMTVRTI